MENIRKPLGTYKLARRLQDCEMAKEALEKQAEELKAQLQSAKNHSTCQEEKVKQLTTKLKRQTESLQRQVENLKTKLVQEISGRQQEKNNNPQDKVQELNDLLGQQCATNFLEHNTRLQLTKELEETKERQGCQKSLKEMFMNKEKETHNDLERLKRLSDKETMNTVRIATKVGNDMKKKKKKLLQKDFEALKVAHIISQEKFSAELQVEKDKNKALQQELEQLKASHQINLRYKTELTAEREKSDSLQKQLVKEIQFQDERVSEKLAVIRQLKAEKDALLQQMEEEIQTLKKNISEKDKSFSKELEDLTEKLNKEASTNQELVTKLQAEERVSQGLRTELAKLKEEQKDKTREQENEKSLHNLPNVELLEEIKDSEEKLEKKKETHSAWKKFRHCMGLRMRKEDKKLEDESKST